MSKQIITRRENGVVIEHTVNGENRLGDRIAAVAQPIAKGIDLATKVLFPRHGTNLANCGGCKKMRDNLNNGMPFPQALRERFKPNQGTNTMTRINATITASDDNNLILETRGRGQRMITIARDENAAGKLLAAIEDAIKANERPVPTVKTQAEPTAAEEAGSVTHS